MFHSTFLTCIVLPHARINLCYSLNERVNKYEHFGTMQKNIPPEATGSEIIIVIRLKLSECFSNNGIRHVFEKI